MICQKDTLHRVGREVPFEARGVDDVGAEEVDGDCTAGGPGFDVGVLWRKGGGERGADRT